METATTKNLKAKIFFQTKSKSDIKVIAEPYFFSVEFTKEKTDEFNKYGSDGLLKTWCEQILKLQHPEYECEIVKIVRL